MTQHKRKSQTKSFDTEHTDLWKKIYSISVFVGLLLIIWEIKLYRRTMIPLYVPLGVVGVSGIIGYLLIKNHFKKVYLLSSEFSAIVMSFLSIGLICCFLFMATNYYLGDDDSTQTKVLLIKKKNEMSGSRRGIRRNGGQPLLTVNYQGRNHHIVFGSGYREKAASADSVELTLKPGFFGFDVIQKQALLHNGTGKSH